ncbi:RimJ/RimL family protein N-acetyltransferase [Geodermatophilus bullaregiensis]|uniref:GNAT family N-acetyltransferase n=1 Tax=Geodermatophilus bullaregiensis TaxID=1564160 RepID=UPI00195872AD|nr:GNAT family N-acetyltransferase [Geodermatophilus bullaregiensis]MBM7806697.1 RimJ/RimL family protein N-acetyltransferase [Geodermatophilus bullaregiensis]
MEPLPVEVPAGPLLLRPWRAGDADDVRAALTDPATDLWSNPGRVRTREDAEVWVARRAGWSSGTRATWAVVGTATGELLGSVSLHAIDVAQGNAEVGYRAVPAVDDPASGRVAATAGLTLEGRLRRSHRYGDGDERDELL